MAPNTRYRKRKDELEADHSPSTNTDGTPPTQKPKPSAARTVPDTVLASDSRNGRKNVSPLSETTTKTSSKRKNREPDDESDDSLRAAKIPVVETPTPSSRFKRKKVDEEDSRESAIKKTRSNNIKKVQFAAICNIVANNFLTALVNKGIKAYKADMQGLEALEVKISNSQTAVRWKKDTEPQFSWLRLPYTATLEKCSVFAVVASTKESFEQKATDLFMSDIIGTRKWEPSMVLVLHHDRTGAQSQQS